MGDDPRIEAVAKVLAEMYCAGYDGTGPDDAYVEAEWPWFADKARAALAAADAAAWRSIDEAPRDGTKVEVCRMYDADGKLLDAKSFGIFMQVAAWWGEEDGWIVYCDLIQEPRLHFEPTHFRYITPPQKPE